MVQKNVSGTLQCIIYEVSTPHRGLAADRKCSFVPRLLRSYQRGRYFNEVCSSFPKKGSIMLENDQKSFVDFSGDWEQIFVLQKFGIMACDFENVLQSE